MNLVRSGPFREIVDPEGLGEKCSRTSFKSAYDTSVGFSGAPTLRIILYVAVPHELNNTAREQKALIYRYLIWRGLSQHKWTTIIYVAKVLK